MSRLVVVSNRIADPRKAAAGGLAVAVKDSLQETGGVWFGWSGRLRGSDQPARSDDVQIQNVGGIQLATIDLDPQDYDAYYLGYSNNVLWPVFHYRLDLAQFDRRFADGYRRVNQLFARKLRTLLRPDDTVWVHDYQLIPLAAELRAMGCTNPIGFFLHIPMPPPPIMAAIPEHEWLMRSLFAYDLVGFQTEADLLHFEHYVESEAGAARLPDGRLRAFGRTLSAGAFPIGINVDEFAALADDRDGIDMFERMRDEYSRRQLLVGVDRLDYTKGLPQRVHAFRELLEQYPENRNRATLIQIAAPSREDLGAYDDLRREMDSLCGAINGDYGELEWMPMRYIHRTVARKRLPGLYRASRVALVTPLRDGMNLVAKEFLAAQDEADPGVLVLSRFAGAAEQLKEALLVNPYDTQGTAQAIQRALAMPLEERRQRHTALMATVRKTDVHWWRTRFLEALIEAAEVAATTEP
ncbi:alpha,alpha-trehalose-phosphate synthase (UDP-forming) [Burkholderia dolosa]|uniref:Trehalose-6-phosphate synthase n=1 Tax=Burkholderia dolosa TaxID=152500 RepID=A0A892IF50_9BURK|nr:MULTISPECIES: alpha,alpha-trehalose-phosphate synthase (UDP-forming) [Burkholderia]AKE05982.1 trehalose-6-phosphate synthase [Burkholderia cepacia]AJY10743.1 alpha,alpha-trehalose-phosphate synthase [Burkholderia dolosa AU0158]AYZ93685.1 alpha,alpha-trehalose-phosphate synthase (UDP-forming) [Burkholderia dolosa]EAY70587.1 Trehalose-6-phosphate synthase [Burkholderia dolosa AU0158]ETP62590.1 alpha,alpha-trehalose-phosphate synthase [Burkholderia dolosa PC543]